MNPQPFGLRSAYPPFIALAIAVAWTMLVVLARRERFPLWRLFATQVIIASAGLTGAVLYNLVESSALQQFGWGAYTTSGLRYPGGLLAVLLVLPLVRLFLPAGMTLAAYLDLIAAPTAIAMAVMRGGCFLMGCCYGYPSRVPWALRYPPLSQVARHQVMHGWIQPGDWSLPVHPLHIYFGLASLAVGLILLRALRRKAFDGQVFLLYLLLHEGAKGLLEFLRGAPPTHSVVHLRIAALSLSALGAVLLFVRARGKLRTWFPDVAAPVAG